MKSVNKAINDKLEYEEMLKETFWGYPSPSKDNEGGYIEPNIFTSPQKVPSQAEQKPFKKKLLNFKRTKSNKENCQRVVRNNPLKLKEFRMQGVGMKNVEKIRKIYADKVLDAPNMVDDFYLNLLDWSKTDLLCIALSQIAYLRNNSNGSITQIYPNSRHCLITSLSWKPDNSNHLAIGLEDGNVEVWDANSGRIVRTFEGHSQRVSSLSWNDCIISTGGLDSSILNHDIRDRNNVALRFEDHTKEV
jgi:hypothetical protein